MSTGRFVGKTVIITGAGRGIGQAAAFRFAEEGAEVMLVARTLAQLEETRDNILADGGSAWAHQADVSIPDTLQGIVDAAMARTGHIDVLINNAGIEDEAEFTEIKEENWDKVIAVNQKAPFLLSQRAAREMKKTCGGSILHNASICALAGGGPWASYHTSKAALLGLNRAMACDLAKYSIRVNCVSPGHTATEMLKEAHGKESIEDLQGSFKHSPMGRMARPSEIASAFAFLASDDASAITGANIVVDCGITASWHVDEAVSDE